MDTKAGDALNHHQLFQPWPTSTMYDADFSADEAGSSGKTEKKEKKKKRKRDSANSPTPSLL